MAPFGHESAINVLMVGAGEYTVGYVPTKDGAASDKPAGVVAITLFDLRRLGVVNRMVLCNVTGKHFPAIRETLQTKIGQVYQEMDISLETYPPDDVAWSPLAYQEAMKTMKKGDIVTIFTPDDTHFEIALSAIEHGLHVLVAKPAVKTLEDHLKLVDAAKKHNVLVAVEYHKRFDPIYADCRDRFRANLGSLSFFSSTMTQPKKQLNTFASWAGKSSDISYYLNSHHIDFLVWSVGVDSHPVQVTANSSEGEAQKVLECSQNVEDCICLMVSWANRDSTRGTSVHMASWIAPPSDCHTQQYFHLLGTKGEVRVDQAHRGYMMSTESSGFASLNPLYMKYTPDSRGYFSGQGGYGYRSIAEFINCAEKLNSGKVSLADIEKEGQIATIQSTIIQTAILEAGRRSLDAGGKAIQIRYNELGQPIGLD